MSMQRPYLLIIDDVAAESPLIDYFAKFGYDIKELPDLSHVSPDMQPAALLINWSNISHNLNAIHKLYHSQPIPLIILSNEFNEDVCVKVLAAGADDFLVKPLHPRELHARISAITRRVQRSLKQAEQEKEVLSFADWRVYPSSRQIFDLRGTELQLSAGEYDLLLAFVRQPHKILGREFLLQITKSTELNPFDRRIDVQVSRLRQKIEIDTKHPSLLKTIRNGGYMLTCDVISCKDENHSDV